VEELSQTWGKRDLKSRGDIDNKARDKEKLEEIEKHNYSLSQAFECGPNRYSWERA